MWNTITIALDALLRVGSVPGGSAVATLDSVYRDEGHVHAHVTLAIATTRDGLDPVDVPLSLGRGVVVTGMTAHLADQSTLVARFTRPGVARERFARFVEAERDPALVEWKAPGRIALDVFPVARFAPVTVELDLVVDPERRDARVDGAVSLLATEADRDEWASLPWGVLRPHVAAVPQCTSNRDTASSVASTVIRASSRSTLSWSSPPVARD